MNALGEGTFARGIFVDLQTAFDTVDHNIRKNRSLWNKRNIK